MASEAAKHRLGNRSSSDASFLERRIRSLALRRTASEFSPDSVGPLGLSLLSQPSETLVDFIFVHGLRGGSRKTWSATPSQAHFWPKEWLPADPAFRHVRIHTFGYDSDWADRKDNSMNVHDFGQSLVEDIKSCPTIPRDSDTPIVLIGHSLGGLVVKKACIVAKENPTFHDIGKRIDSLYFLATPHRGSDLARTLNNVIRASLSSGKSYVSNLERGSEAIQVLNDQFRHYHKGIHIHSFIESVNMNIGLGTTLIVDRESATLGYENERIQTLNANHRTICKFEDPTDHNYRTLRNRLASTVDDIVKTVSSRKHQMYRDQMSSLSKYLGISHDLQYELSTLEDDRLAGSCEWLTNKSSFQEWQFLDDSARYFWLKGRPATGKSMISSHVIDNLEGTRCSYYFFKHGNKERSSLSGFFRSIAYQMARTSLSIREHLLAIAQEDFSLDRDDYRSIWRKLFIGGVFSATFHHMHYWVIDALDECAAAERRNFDNLFSMFSKIDEHVLLKIFITSRPSADLERLLSPLPVISDQVTVEDTQHDIRLYVETNAESLPVDDEDTRQDLVQRIVNKSSGCFLWTVLVMQQLQDVYSLEETEQVLEEIPQEMEPLYQRNLSIMSRNTRTKRLAMTILRWAVCAARPLSVEELKDAVKLDIGDTVTRDLEGSISSLCGQLVYVDRSSRVQMVHQTARAFLTEPELSSEFRVDTPPANLHLAQACLRYLTSEDMAFTAKRKSIVSISRESPKNALAHYACTFFSEHVLRAPSASDALYKQLGSFFATNVLSWMQRIAEAHDLTTIIRTGKHLKAYLLRRAKHVPTLRDDVESWATDLPRIATEFGVNLLDTPSAIHALVAPLCPRNSMIYRQFSTRSDNLIDGIQLQGLSYSDWHDRISCIYFRNRIPKAIACRDHRFAIGLSDGMIELYKTSSCEHVRHFRHGETVRILQFGDSAQKLASAGLRSIKLWDAGAGSCLLNIAMETNPMALAFDEEQKLIITGTRSKEVVTWHTDNAVVASHYVWDDRLPGRTPTNVVISMEHKLMALIYRGLPVNMWCMDTQQLLGACSRPSTSSNRVDTFHGITSVVFNPNPDVWLLAVAYWDGELALYDTLRRDLKHSITSDAQTLAVSPDGRTLAGGSTTGKVQLYDFETLQLLYDITLSGSNVAALTFTSDNLRFLDLRGSQTNVWEPSILVRKDFDDRNSEPSDAVVSAVSESRVKPYEEMAIITTLVCCDDGATAICGRNNGVVDIQELLFPKKPAVELYRHKGSFAEVILLGYLHSKRLVVSVDNAGCFRVVQLAYDNAIEMWTVRNEILEERLESVDTVNQAIFSSEGSTLLLSTSKRDIVWSLTTKQVVASNDHVEARKIWKWYTHARRPEEVLLFDSFSLHRRAWTTLAQVSDPIPLKMWHNNDETFEVDNILADPESELLLFRHAQNFTKAQQPAASGLPNRLASTQIFSLSPSSTTISHTQGKPLSPTPQLPFHRTLNRPEIDTIIRIIKTEFDTYSLIFLSQSGWVCSVELNAESDRPENTFRRHFFVPMAWLSTSAKVIVRVTEMRDVVFVRGEELAIIKNGLENVEVVDMDGEEGVA